MRQLYGKPYDDNVLEYDFDNHRYRLTKNYISNIDKKRPLADDDLADIIEDVSDNIYLFIYSKKTGQTQYDIMEYELACNHAYREWIALALTKQYQYASETSGDKVYEQHGVDINNDKVIDIAQLRNELFVSYKSIIILQNHEMLTNQAPDSDFTEDKYRVGY